MFEVINGSGVEREPLSIVRGISDEDRGATYAITAAGFCLEDTDGLRRDVDEHIDGAEIQYSVKTSRSKLAGFAVYRLMTMDDSQLLYLSGVQIEPKHQGIGIAKRVNKLAIEESDPDYFAFRTQSIRMYRSGISLPTLLDYYPKLLEETDPTIPEKFQKLGRALTDKIGGKYPISRGFYNHAPLYGEKPTHVDDEEFYRRINFMDGDAVLCIASLGKYIEGGER